MIITPLTAAHLEAANRLLALANELDERASLLDSALLAPSLKSDSMRERASAIRRTVEKMCCSR